MRTCANIFPTEAPDERIWFTEVAARKCSDFDGRLVKNGESGQARRADWLVNTLIKNAKPEHVFYYELLLKERRWPDCQTEGSDSALYEPSADPAEPDRPRAAAAYIRGGAERGAGKRGGGYEDAAATPSWRTPPRRPSPAASGSRRASP